MQGTRIFLLPTWVELRQRGAPRYIGGAIDFTRDIPTRVKTDKLDSVSVYSLLAAALAVIVALVTDTALVFSKLQGESGEMDMSGLGAVNWLAVIIVTAVAVIIAAVLICTVRMRNAKTEKD